MGIGGIVALQMMNRNRGNGGHLGCMGILSAMFTASFVMFWVISYCAWTVDRDYTTIEPCNEPNVCDTFKHYLVRHEWREFKDQMEHLW